MGEREIVVGAMNVDDIRSRGARKITPGRLAKMKVDIATIQETLQIYNGDGGSRIHLLYNSRKKKRGGEEELSD